MLKILGLTCVTDSNFKDKCGRTLTFTCKIVAYSRGHKYFTTSSHRKYKICNKRNLMWGYERLYGPMFNFEKGFLGMDLYNSL